MLGLLIQLLLVVVIFGIVWWALSQAPIPPPMRWVVNVVLAIIAIIVLIWFVGPLIGSASPTLGPHTLR